MATILLEMKDIIKKFSGVTALENVNFQVETGEIHALIGENGAGKSTLMNILSGTHPYGTYEGDIIYDGEPCHFNTIKDSEAKGIVIIHQELALIPNMSIGENLFLGNERGKKMAIDWNATHEQATQLLKTVGLTESSRTPVKDLGVGKQQLVEIAKALAKNARLLILDEPTSSLNETDSRALLDLLLQFKKEGLTSIIISHKLNEIAYVADKITILRDGSTIETLDMTEGDIPESRIISGMVGRELSDRYPKRPDVKIGDIRMEVDHWNVYHPQYHERKVVDDVSFNVRSGEVVGISGLMGAGRTELAMSLFGQSYGHNITGELKIDGKPLKLKNSHDAIENKLAYITEDRKGNGLILSNPIRTNITLANLDSISSRGVLDNDKEYLEAQDYADRLKVKRTSIEQHIANLSGGNQQKVLIAKWVFTQPDVLILDEPTRGIDVGAKYEIYCIINEMVAHGKSVIMISSELPEILGMSDRIYVMNEGKMVAQLDKKDATQEVIMEHILRSTDKVIASPASGASKGA
ncbi:sugar ABC transporter ATP-binding protein [Eubacteriales bacterium OttesenSCG-928-N13]|nr:sugar ABC transporter ATP-binding protein [Eubacteriales bacterium OttesenSCG-928-N13]